MLPLEQVIGGLPPEIRQEMEGIVRLMQEKPILPPGGKLRQSWAGGLGDLRGRYGSMELQAEAYKALGL